MRRTEQFVNIKKMRKLVNYLKLLVLILIIPFVPFLLALFKLRKHSSFVKKWFYEFYIYLIYLIRNSVIAYAVILLLFITACTIIKPLDFNSLATLDVHLKIFIVAWTLSFIGTGFKKPIFSNTD
jgi:uncharacterized membrane protein